MALTKVSGGMVEEMTRVNAIINGDFNIWQRGTTFSSVADGTNVADRWNYVKSGSMVHDVVRSTDQPTVATAGRLFNYSLLVDCTTADASIAAGEYCVLQQKIEGFNFVPLSQRSFTLSFWVKATKTGTYCVSFRNSGLDRSYVAEYTVSSADTWEYKIITVTASPTAGTWDNTNGIGLVLGFALAAGSTFHTTAGAWQTGNLLATANQVNATDNTANNFRITGVQVEPGDTASPFATRLIGQELTLCQRYYEKSFPQATAPAQNAGTTGAFFCGQAGGAAAAQTLAWVPFRVTKRAAPGAVTLYNPSAANGQIRNNTDSADWSGSTAAAASEHGFVLTGTSSAGGAAGEQAMVHWSADAEF